MIEPLTLSAMAAMISTSTVLVSPMPVQSADDVAKAVEAVEEIIADYRAEEQEFGKLYRAAETDEERQALFEDPGPPNPAAKFEMMHEIATKHAGTQAAADAAQWVMSMAGRLGPDASSADWALDMLLTDFMNDEQIAEVPLNCSGMTSKNIETLERIRAETSVERAKALADFVRGQQLLTMSDAAKELVEEGSSGNPYMSYYMQGIDDELKEKLSSAGMAEECREAGLALLRHCEEAYPEVEYREGSGQMVAAKAAGQLFEMNNLQIGDVAPDIIGVDAEGVEFKLSDYRGQVVVIDFWGFW